MDFNVTPRAIQKILTKFSNTGNSECLFRVGLKAGGCMGINEYFEFIDKYDEKDIVINLNEIKIIIDPKSFLLLNGATLDWSNDLMSQKFLIKFKEARQSCSCGASYSL